ncbi:hypothetical protein [Novosphingobium sp. AAP93]|uniref:hypothetical protein n=1 Tax=Novosphingobium sp. AAP93 TaxID=1523427 RepID=UPI0006B9CB37|nr:hypothetical protein [Novosphingobium sp. AAP93]KPF77593.1 hypothetical protein IP83_19410 [Novosphingobium sp. AAP93]
MLAFAFLSAGAAPVGKLGGAPPLQVPVARIVIALLICSALAFCLALLIKRRGRIDSIRAVFRPLAYPPQEVRILEVRRIGVHGDIALIRHRDRQYLVLVQAGSSTVLREESVVPEEAAV